MTREVWTDPRVYKSHIVSLRFWKCCAPLEAKYCHKCGDRLKQNVTEREASVDEGSKERCGSSATILDKINGTSGLPLPHFNDAKMARFCSFPPPSLLWGEGG